MLIVIVLFLGLSAGVTRRFCNDEVIEIVPRATSQSKDTKNFAYFKIFL